MDYDRRIFAYPAVEYIPLTPQTLARIPGHPLPPGEGSRPTLQIRQSHEPWWEILANLPSPPLPSKLQVPPEELLLLAENCEILDLNYRGFEVICRGVPQPGGYHLFTITRRYFYKQELTFSLYLGTVCHARAQLTLR